MPTTRQSLFALRNVIGAAAALAFSGLLLATGPDAARADAGCSQTQNVIKRSMDDDLPYYIKYGAPSQTFIDRVIDGAHAWNFLTNPCGLNDITDFTFDYRGRSSIGWQPGHTYSRIDFAGTSGIYGCQGGLACAITPNFYEFDIRFNPYYSWSTAGTYCGANRDVWSVSAHEFGHAVALRHATYSGWLTMYTYPGELGRCFPRSLGRGDVAGLRAIHGP
jgi:hypothetical protein